MDEINAIAARHGNLPVIEDAAQSFGASYKGMKSGNLSAMGCTSFFPSKPLGCYGDGGAVFTSDESLAKACREIRVHGQSRRYVHTRIGVGGRMDTIQCAIVLAKLDRFEWEIGQRQRAATRYNEQLSSLAVSSPADSISLLTVKPGRTSVFAQYTILVDDRDAVQTKLENAGIPTAVHYPIPLNEQPAYERHGIRDRTPVSSEVSKRVMSLPMSADLNTSDQDLIINTLKSAIKQ